MINNDSIISKGSGQIMDNLHKKPKGAGKDTVLEEIKTLLKPNGCLAVIEFKKVEGPPMHIRLSENEVEKMVTRHGFVKKKTVHIGELIYHIYSRVKIRHPPF